MSGHRPPWFPGQFGRADDDATRFTGDPYPDEPTGDEPYAPASLNRQVTNPYGDVPAPPQVVPGGDAWLPDDVPSRADPAAEPAAPGAPTAGYETFYEPGSVPRSDLKRRRRGRRDSAAQSPSRSRSARRHGPRADRRKNGQQALAAATPPSSDTPATTADRAPAITVVPGGTAESRRAGDGGPSKPTRRPRSRRRTVARLAVLAVVAGSIVVGWQVARDADEPPTASPTPAASATPAPPRTPGPTPDPLPSPTAVTPPSGEMAVGATVAEGPFEVEVVGVTTGLAELTGSTATATAEGEFVVVRLRVTATGAGPQYFLDIDQRLLDAAGGGHGADPRAAMAVDGNQLWFAELDQGESAEGVVVFDVPDGTSPAAIEVHASDGGAGVRVELPAS